MDAMRLGLLHRRIQTIYKLLSHWFFFCQPTAFILRLVSGGEYILTVGYCKYCLQNRGADLRNINKIVNGLVCMYGKTSQRISKWSGCLSPCTDVTLIGTIEDPSSSTASASLFQGEVGAFNSVESRTLFDTVGIIKWPNFTFGLS